MNSKKIKCKFIILKKKTIIFALVLLLILNSIIFLPSVFASTKVSLGVVVIDAGHGGIDGGCEGVSGTTERVINLEYAKTLKSYFENYGYKVVMTRENLDGLYSNFSSNKKKDDMLARKKIIENANADVVISIHMNAFPLQSSRGAQVFYSKEHEVSKKLAECIQDVFIENLPKARKNADVGDYYLLNCSNIPSVIVECGFLSNPEEEQLLLSENYREKLCYSIMCGVAKYFYEIDKININN